MRALQILSIILIIGFCSCKSINPYRLESYNLKGPVKDVFEKSILTFCDSISGSELLLDSSTITFKNYFFSSDGKVLKWEYFDKDSLLLYYDDYIYSSESGKFLTMYRYEGDSKYSVIEDRKICNTLKTKTFDTQTKELISVYKIHYRHGLPSKTKSRYVKKNIQKIYKWKRDSHENEIKVVITSSHLPPVEFSIFYLEFDTHGNWTQRYLVDFETGDCFWVFRRINYY